MTSDESSPILREGMTSVRTKNRIFVDMNGMMKQANIVQNEGGTHAS